MRFRDLATLVAKGLAAGAAGTAVMTGVQMAEARIRGRGASKAPAEAVEKLTGFEPDTEKGEERLNYAAHFGYGTAWGVPRAFLGLTPLPGLVATGLHFVAVQATALGMLPALGVAPPPTRWKSEDLVADTAHHLVYALATGVVVDLLTRRR